MPWSVIEQFDDVDDDLDTWEKLFMDVVNTHAPLRERRVKRPRQPGGGGVETSNPCDIADAFNRFFTTMADTHVPRNNHMPESEFVTLSEHVRTKLFEGSTFVIPNVDL